MGLEKYAKFLPHAANRFIESVKDAKDEKPRNKAEATRAATDGFNKLLEAGRIVAEEQMAWAKLAEALVSLSMPGAVGANPPKAAPPNVVAVWPAFLREEPEAVAIVEAWLVGLREP